MRTDNLPTLVVTNPILNILYEMGWEDPEWGKNPVNQVTIALAIHKLAGHISDPSISEDIQKITTKVISKAATEMESYRSGR